MFFSTSQRFRSIGLPLMAVALFALAGGHWAVLQGVAWTRMIVSYSQDTGSLIAGMEKTFSGRNPCAMCRKIQEAHQQEEKTPATIQLNTKVEVFYVATGKWITQPPHRTFDYPAPDDAPALARCYPPPAPIPISLS